MIGSVNKLKIGVNSYGKPAGYGFINVTVNAAFEDVLRRGFIMIKGTKLRVERAQKKGDSKQYNKFIKERKIYAAGLPPNLSDFELTKIFSRFGAVKKAYVVRKANGFTSKNFGFVIYEEPESLNKALEAKRIKFSGKKIGIYKADDSKTRSSSIINSDSSPIGKNRVVREHQHIESHMEAKGHNLKEENLYCNPFISPRVPLSTNLANDTEQEIQEEALTQPIDQQLQ